MQDQSYDPGHVHFVPQNTVFFDVRTRGGRWRGQEEGFARNVTTSIFLKKKQPSGTSRTKQDKLHGLCCADLHGNGGHQSCSRCMRHQIGEERGNEGQCHQDSDWVAHCHMVPSSYHHLGPGIRQTTCLDSLTTQTQQDLANPQRPMA